jgi:hypothetical protein
MTWVRIGFTIRSGTTILILSCAKSMLFDLRRVQQGKIKKWGQAHVVRSMDHVSTYPFKLQAYENH